MIAAIWRIFRAWRFRLFQRHRYRHLVLEWIAGCPFVVLPEVFNPGLFPTGAFLAAELPAHISAGMRVLDMGTGSGIGAVFAAKQGAVVTAADINPEAVRCATVNALLNKVEDCIQAVQSDLFAAIPDEKFDRVLFNPPYYRGKAQDLLDHAWRSENTVERFAVQLADHLTPNGYALVVLSTDGDLAGFLNTFRANRLTVEVVAQQNLISEMVTIYRLVPGG